MADARAQFAADTHQRSPGASPGKPYSGLGVLGSLPMLRWLAKALATVILEGPDEARAR